jgi:hypothetical protein
LQLLNDDRFFRTCQKSEKRLNKCPLSLKSKEKEMWQSIIGYIFQKVTILFPRKKEEKCDQFFFQPLGGGGVLNPICIPRKKG